MRIIWATLVTMLALTLINFVPTRSLADHAVINMEFLGSLIEDTPGQFRLLVDGQKWGLDMERWQIAKAKDYRKIPDGKVTVQGDVQVFLQGQTLALKDRRIKVSEITQAIPTVVVKAVPEGSTAKKYGLLVGDRIMRIQDPKNEREIQPDLQSEDNLRMVLKDNKGKEVTIYIIRQRDYVTIDNVKLPFQNTNILGAPVEIVWMPRSAAAVPPPAKKQPVP